MSISNRRSFKLNIQRCNELFLITEVKLENVSKVDKSDLETVKNWRLNILRCFLSRKPEKKIQDN